MDLNQDTERQLHKLQRRARKRRSNYRRLFMLILLGVFVIMLAELGRTLAYSQDLAQFIQQVDKKSPTEIKDALHRYSRGFNDHNPVIRKASMTVFKFTTREEFGDDLAGWKRWWLENRDTWQYLAPPPDPADDLTPIPVPESRPPAGAMKLFHWGLLLRYMVYGVIPIVVGLILLERFIGAGSTGNAILLLALLLPFIAIGWLAYQHWRHRGR